MKKLFTLLAIALFGVAMWSCSYDDDDLWKAVDDLDSRMEAMEQAMKSANTDIDALQKLVDALQKNVTVTSVIKNNDGFSLMQICFILQLQLQEKIINVRNIIKQTPCFFGCLGKINQDVTFIFLSCELFCHG